MVLPQTLFARREGGCALSLPAQRRIDGGLTVYSSVHPGTPRHYPQHRPPSQVAERAATGPSLSSAALPSACGYAPAVPARGLCTPFLAVWQPAAKTCDVAQKPLVATPRSSHRPHDGATAGAGPGSSPTPTRSQPPAARVVPSSPLRTVVDELFRADDLRRVNVRDGTWEGNACGRPLAQAATLLPSVGFEERPRVCGEARRPVGMNAGHDQS